MTDTIDATVGVTEPTEEQRRAVVKALFAIAAMVDDPDLPLPHLWERSTALDWNVRTAEEFLAVAKAIGATEIKVHRNVEAVRRVGPLSLMVYTSVEEFAPDHVDRSAAVKATVCEALGVSA